MSFVKKYIYPFIILFAIFSEQIFYSYTSAMGLTAVSGMLQQLFIPVFVISIVYLCLDIKERDDFKKFHIRRVLFALLFVTAYYYFSTYFAFCDINPLHTSSLLRFGSICVASSLLGMHLIKHPCIKEIDKLLPYFIIPIGLIMGTLGYESTVYSELLHDDSGLNYQNLSYYMAELYAFCAYYLFFSNERFTRFFKIKAVIIFLMMLFCAIMCLMSGGRGAFVYVVVITLIFVAIIAFSGRIKKRVVIPGILLAIAFFYYLFAKMDVFDTVGFNRIFTTLGDDENRIEQLNRAIYYFGFSPVVGYGLGSVWWVLGYYSHNILLDLLVETGIIGAIFVIAMLIKVAKNIYSLLKLDISFVFLMIVFLRGLLMSFFSGYWITIYQIWFVIGVILAMPDVEYYKGWYKKWKNRN